MQKFNNLEIHTLGILLFFTFYFMFHLFKFYKNMGKKSLLKRNKTVKKMKRLSWDDFEKLTEELFEKEGWIVEGNSKKGADGGIDLWMYKKSFGKKVKAIVQCKRYDETRVTVKVVREMYGLMFEHDVESAFIVTTSYFTKECYSFVKGKKITLINGKKLEERIQSL